MIGEEITIGPLGQEVTYKIVIKLSAMKQFFIFKRLLPVVGTIAVASGILPKVMSGDTESAKTEIMGRVDELSSSIGPICQGIASMKDEDSEFVIFTCLDTVQRRTGGAWSRITVQGSNRLMFEDMDLPTILQLVGKVIMENMAGFFSLLQQESASVEKASA